MDLVRSYLEADGFVVSEAYDGPTALEVAAREEPQVVVLDVVLPGFDGFEVCRRLRHFSNAYVLMLTSKSQEIDKLIGLSVGADDYLTKPFSPRELVARVKAMLRRAEMGAAQGTPGRWRTNAPRYTSPGGIRRPGYRRRPPRSSQAGRAYPSHTPRVRVAGYDVCAPRTGLHPKSIAQPYLG